MPGAGVAGRHAAHAPGSRLDRQQRDLLDGGEGAAVPRLHAD